MIVGSFVAVLVCTWVLAACGTAALVGAGLSSSSQGRSDSGTSRQASGGGSPATAAEGSPGVGTTRAGDSQAGGGRAAATSPPPAGLGRCSVGQLRAGFDLQPPSGPRPPSRVRVLVVVTDRSSSPCFLDGFLGVAAQVAKGVRSISVTNLDQPGSPRPVTLQTGGSAFAGAVWTSGPSCPAVTGFLVSLPARHAAGPRAPHTPTGGVAVALDVPGGTSGSLTLCPGTFALGPLEQTAAGEVAFAS